MIYFQLSHFVCKSQIQTFLSVQRPLEDDFEDEKYSTTTSAPTKIPTTTATAPTNGFDYEVGDNDYPADEPTGPDTEHEGEELCDVVQGCNSIDTLNFGHKIGPKTQPHSGPNSVLGHKKFRHVSKLQT